MFNRYVIRGECGFEGAHHVPFGPQPEEVAGLSPFSSSTPGGRLRAGDLPGRFGISLRGVYPTQDCVHAPACPRHILGSRRLDSRPLGPGIFLSAARCTFSSRRRGEILCFRRDLAFCPSLCRRAFWPPVLLSELGTLDFDFRPSGPSSLDPKPLGTFDNEAIRTDALQVETPLPLGAST